MEIEGAGIPEGEGSVGAEAAELDRPDFTREEQRETLYERMDHRVELLLSIEDRLDGVPLDTDIQDILEESHREVHTGLTPDLDAGVHRTRALGVQIEKLEGRWNAAIDYDSAVAERAELLENDDIRFVVEMDGILIDLGRKNSAVRTLKSQEQVAQYASLDLGKRIDVEDIVEVRRTPVDVTLILKHGRYNQVSRVPQSNGYHRRGTPLSIVRESPIPEFVDEVVRHEHTHTLLEGSSTMNDRVGVRSRWELARITEPSHTNAELRGRVRESTERTTATTVQLVLDDLHNEFLAQLAQREDEGFGTTAVEAEEAKQLDRFFHHAERHATAGNQATESLYATLNHANETKEAGIRESMKNLAEGIERGFVRFMDEANRSLYIGKQLDRRDPSADVDRRVHALLYLLPPTKYRHIERYLRHRYGNERVDVVLGSTENEPK